MKTLMILVSNIFDKYFNIKDILCRLSGLIISNMLALARKKLKQTADQLSIPSRRPRVT